MAPDVERAKEAALKIFSVIDTPSEINVRGNADKSVTVERLEKATG